MFTIYTIHQKLIDGQGKEVTLTPEEVKLLESHLDNTLSYKRRYLISVDLDTENYND
jgi:hypothetical protein